MFVRIFSFSTSTNIEVATKPNAEEALPSVPVPDQHIEHARRVVSLIIFHTTIHYLNLKHAFLVKYIMLYMPIKVTFDKMLLDFLTHLSQLSTPRGKIGAPGAVAAKHVEEG